MEYIIGREGNQPYPITDKTVSRHHCSLTPCGDGSYLLKHLSATGDTYVNGRQVIRATVTENDTLQLGPQFTIKISQLLAHQDKITGKNISGGQTEQMAYSIAHLEKIWDAYSEQKIKLQQETIQGQNYRMLLPVASSVIVFLASFLLGEGLPARLLQVVILAGGSFWIYKTVSNKQQQSPEKQDKLNQQFMIDYVCPKCKNFLGYVPYRNLKNKGTCNYCKTKWIDHV